MDFYNTFNGNQLQEVFIMVRCRSLSAPLALSAVIALGACTAPEIEAVSNVDIQGQDVAAEAAREYKRLAQYEAEVMWDRASAVAFAEKALAAVGGDVAPDDANAMPLDAKSRAEIRDAYKALQTLRASGADEVSPKTTGQAIARLDCWNEQANEGFQDSHIGFCKHSFSEYAGETARTLKAAGLGHGDVIMGARSFSVTFPLGSATPKPGGEHIIAAAARHALSKNDLKVVLGGHADRSGSAVHNRQLSEARAATVAEILQRHGVPLDRISTIGFGETYPKTMTPDGIRHTDNRRVEIVVGPVRPL